VHSHTVPRIWGFFTKFCPVVFWENFPKNARPENHRKKKIMRISEDRYSRERLCLQVALRFLEHEARTQTIRAWTGLSDDRIQNSIALI
jgi:hypothetical protein